jgi:hypothetical protein
MRRNRSGGPELERQVERPGSDPCRCRHRRALWSSYYHRFFGRVRPGDRLPGGVEPMSLDDTTLILNGALADPHPPPREQDVARRCVSQMLIYGYRPGAYCRDAFDTLVRKAAHRRADDGLAGAGARNAKEFLRLWGEREFGPTPIDQALLREEMQAVRRRRLLSLPTRLVHVDGAFEAEKEVFLRTGLAAVGELVNPENWERMGEFFARTYRERGDENDTTLAAATPWHGVLREDFVVSWNGFTTNAFRQRLKVDYTVTPTVLRTDYALMYEEDDQIVANEGFLEVRADDGLEPGWIRGRMRKRIKFTSTVLNLLCPALLSMMLDSQAGGFNTFLPGEEARRARARS